MRKPRLYEAGTLEFTNNGLGSLIHATQCEVKRAFGAWVLEMEYPVAGRLFRELTHRRIILAETDPLEDMQPFSIYRIVPSSNGTVKIYANHVCYDLQGKPVRPFTASTATEAMEKLKGNAMEEHPFTFETDVGSNGSFALKQPAATWSVLGGVEGSILDTFHGEYEFDNYTVRLRTRLGQDRGVKIRYGKNLQTLEQDASCAGCYTGIVPFWVDAGTGKSVYAEAVKAEGDFGYSRILPVDFTGKFETKPTAAQLTERAQQYIKDNDIGVPTVGLKVKFVPLDQTEELSYLAILERVGFGDTVTVYFPKLGIDVSARVVETCYDSLRGKYKDLIIGRVKQSLAELIVNQQKQVEKIPQGTALQIAMAQATAAIMGAKGGSVRQLDTDGDGMTDTIYVADNADPAQAVKVWRWNYEGWGVSKTGYDGPFVMAATLESGFAAEFITSGKIDTERLDVDELSAAIAKVIQLTADSITTGKLSVDRLDVEKLVVQALRAVENREDGFQGIVVTDTGRVRIYSNDGSVIREVANLGADALADNFATTWANMSMKCYHEGVESFEAQVGSMSIAIMSKSAKFGKNRKNGFFVSEDTGDIWAELDDIYATPNGYLEWVYVESIGREVLTRKTVVAEG